MLFVATGCSAVLCNPGSYDRGVGQCPADRYVVNVALATDRTDLRDSAAFPIQVEAMATDASIKFKLAQVQSVRLDIDGGTFTDVRNTVGEDAQSVLVTRIPEQLKLGALRATVTLPELPAASTDGLHRVFRSPKLVATPEQVMGTTTSSNRSGMVTGRAVVQIASPVGAAGQVLALEEVTAGGMQYRWLDLYVQDANSMLTHANNAQWQLTQNKLGQGPLAQETLVQGAVLIYDYDMGTKRNDLALQPLQGNVQNGLSQVEMSIPADATILAGCSEESAILLAHPGAVLGFRIDPAVGAKAVSNIGTFMTQGTALIAARDITAMVPNQRSADYFAVVWESSGKGTLLKLTKTAGSPTGLEVGPDVTRVGGVGLTAAALADLDSDGLQDLILAAADGTLMWSPQHPDTSFEPATSLGVSASGAVSISVGDVNQDGLPDVAVATKDKRLLIFRNQP